jgi:Spy/CpxP family protein refolding chaperone
MVIFVCGVVTGALVIRTHDGKPSPPSRAPGDPGIGIPGSAPVWEILRRLTPLGLTTNQAAKIAKIMQDSQATNAAIRTTIAPQLQKEVERAHQAINQLLTPDQQKKYAELLKRPEPRPEGRGRRGGEGGPFPPRNTNRPQTNGIPGEGRGRTNRTGGTNDPSTNSIPTISFSTNDVSTNTTHAIGP